MRMVWQDMSPFPSPRMDPEEEREMRLAAQARLGAEWALAALIARYQPPVLRYLIRLTGHPYQSRRMAERIFVRMERRLHGPHGAEYLRLWLLRAATEVGLDILRHPRHSHQPSRLNAPAGPHGLLTDGLPAGAADRLRTRLDRLAAKTGSTRRQARQLIWKSGPADDHAAPQARESVPADPAGPAPDALSPVDPALDTMSPQEELRHRLIRMVLSELPYGDAQCLALHLVAGLNQTEVAKALGIRPSAARRRIVQGLQMFAHRYEATVTNLGVPNEIAYGAKSQRLPATASDVMDALDERQAPIPSYPEPEEASPPHREVPVYTSSYPGDADAGTDFPEPQGNHVSAPAASAPITVPITAPARGAPMPTVVDALPVVPSDTRPAYRANDTTAEDGGSDVPDDSWLEQPTMVPILSAWSVAHPPETGPETTASDTSPPAAPAQVEMATETTLVPVLTPPYRS